MPPTNCLLLTAKQEPYGYMLTKNIEEFSGKSLEERASRHKTIDRKGNTNRTRQKNKREDSKVESNGSPEIPDRWETSDISSLPSGVL